tara:strand:+ start:199 stop:876 length:678 start_codon:yes stop_codon:yes gene_type:complete
MDNTQTLEQNHQGKLANALTRALNYRDYQLQLGRKLFLFSLQSGLYNPEDFKTCIAGFKRSTTTNAGAPYSPPADAFSWIGTIEGGEETGAYHLHAVLAFHLKELEHPHMVDRIALYFESKWLQQCARFNAKGDMLLEPTKDHDAAAWIHYLSKHAKQATTSCVKPKNLLGKSYTMSCRLPDEVKAMNDTTKMPRYSRSRAQIERMCLKDISGYTLSAKKDNIPF